MHGCQASHQARQDLNLKDLPPSKICKGVELAIEISSKQKGQPLHWQHLFGLNVLN